MGDVFFEEWIRRGPGAARSVSRAAALARALGVGHPGVPVISVVGSKGKGTAAIYASAFAAAAGRRVVTVTSPALRRERERIRVDGRSVTDGELADIAGTLRAAIAGLPAQRADREYLSPGGLFMLGGVLHARRTGADLIVLEAGMGGVSDEIGLFPPSVLAITEIFGEHLGVLGDTPAAIAADKAGIAAPETLAVLSLPQTLDVSAAIEATVTGRRGAVEIVRGEGPFRSKNARLGCAAAERLLGMRPPGLERVLATVRLPARMSEHPVPGSDSTIFVDSAVNRAGIAAALAVARAGGDIDHVLVSLPDDKDVAGAVAELSALRLPVTFVRVPRARLRFTTPLPWEIVDAGALNLPVLGRRIVALGTISFTGLVLDLVDADTDRLFTA